MVEPPAEFYSRNAARQDREYPREEMPETFVRHREKFVELVGRGRVLDAGCGPGMDTDYFIEEGLDAVGVDIGEGCIDYARENKKGEFQVQDLRDLKFEGNSFDGVWCSAAVFFFTGKDGIKESIDEFNRVLKAGGVLYIDFKVGDGETVKQKWDGSVREYHLSDSEAGRMLTDGGFEIIHSDENQGARKDKRFTNFMCRKKGERNA